MLLVAGIYLLLNSSTSQIPSMMGTVPTNNNGVIALVLIATAIIAAMALVLYFVYSKNEKRERPKIEPPSYISQSKTEEHLPATKEKTYTKDSRPFDVFICYKKSSGKDYADHLKAGLEELGLHSFEDCRDIPQAVDTEEGWACSRDKALEDSKYFVLIMTPGFDLSREVVKEIGMARKQGNKTFVYFRHRSMGRNIVVNLGDEVLDIGKLEQVSFETKEELLRLAHNILLKDKTP
ncbi:MAG: toll/interleukin-1 receptor domain-containing protein [Chloroflexi bacterium]|nr:toll/interleukin-1 receptor domain-containing protein [Chloroflexota bacterium]